MSVRLYSPKSCILTGDEASEAIAVDQQSSTDVSNQEIVPPAVSGGQEELHKEAPSEETRSQSPSCQSAEEEPVIPQTETPGGEERCDSSQAQVTIDLTALTSHQSNVEERLSDPPPTGTDGSDLGHLQETSENSGGGEDESDEGAEEVEAAETKCILTEENSSSAISAAAAAAASSAEEQEDVRSEQETELSDETDVCVSEDIQG